MNVLAYLCEKIAGFFKKFPRKKTKKARGHLTMDHLEARDNPTVTTVSSSLISKADVATIRQHPNELGTILDHDQPLFRRVLGSMGSRLDNKGIELVELTALVYQLPRSGYGNENLSLTNSANFLNENKMECLGSSEAIANLFNNYLGGQNSGWTLWLMGTTNNRYVGNHAFILAAGPNGQNLYLSGMSGLVAENQKSFISSTTINSNIAIIGYRPSNDLSGDPQLKLFRNKEIAMLLAGGINYATTEYQIDTSVMQSTRNQSAPGIPMVVFRPNTYTIYFERASTGLRPNNSYVFKGSYLGTYFPASSSGRIQAVTVNTTAHEMRIFTLTSNHG